MSPSTMGVSRGAAALLGAAGVGPEVAGGSSTYESSNSIEAQQMRQGKIMARVFATRDITAALHLLRQSLTSAR